MNTPEEQQLSKKHKINFLKGGLVLGIVIVLNLFFNQAISLFYDAPTYEDYCPQRQVTKHVQTEEECVGAGGAWNENQYYPDPSQLVPVIEKQPIGWCDLDYTCRQEYEDVNSVYNRNVFVILVILGMLSIIAGFVLNNTEAVSLGLTYGGVMSLFIGNIRYWSDMDEYVRFIVLTVALAVLVWLGVKKMRD